MLISVNANTNMRRNPRKPYVPTPEEVKARTDRAEYKKSYKVKPSDAKHLAVLRHFDIDELTHDQMSPTERKAAEHLVKSGLLVKRKSGKGYNTTDDGDIALEKVVNQLENAERDADDDEEDAMDQRQIERQRKLDATVKKAKPVGKLKRTPQKLAAAVKASPAIAAKITKINDEVKKLRKELILAYRKRLKDKGNK